MADTLETIVARERETLTARRSDIQGKIKELEKQLTELDREFNAVAAYEAAKKGRTVSIGGATGSRSSRGSRQNDIMGVLGKHTAGVTRGDIIDALGAKGNKSAEQSISNALSNMKKANKITLTDGKYTAA